MPKHATYIKIAPTIPSIISPLCRSLFPISISIKFCWTPIAIELKNITPDIEKKKHVLAPSFLVFNIKLNKMMKFRNLVDDAHLSQTSFLIFQISFFWGVDDT